MESKYGDSSGELNFASAPKETMYAAFDSDPLELQEPVFKSFADLSDGKMGSRTSWLKDPDSGKDFFSLSRDKDWLKKNSDWVLPSNAETQSDLLRQANNTQQIDEFKNTATMGTRVLNGQFLFTTNRNKQKVYGEGCWQFATSPYTRPEARPIDLKDTKNNWHVQNANILILTLGPSQIAVALRNRKPVILLPGRHCYNDPNFVLDKKDVWKIEKNRTDVKTLTVTIVMILPGYLGLGYEKANPVLLKPGLHVSRLPSFRHQNTISTRSLLPISGDTSQYPFPGAAINHGNIHIVRVKQSEYGCARIHGTPRFLKPGLHIYNNPSFSFFAIKKRTDQLIEFENLRIIQVPTNQIGCGWDGNRPVFIPPGIWTKTSPLFRFEKFESATKQTIKHGSLTRYQVHNGEIGFAWNNAKVEELHPGIRVVDNPNFIFEMTKKKNTPVIRFGNIAHVTTQQGFCRPVYEDGELSILESGYHKFTNPNLIVKDAFPVGQIILRLKQMEVLTRDRTPMLVTGQVTYQVVDPKNLILNLGYDILQSSLEKSIDAILRHAFSLTDLSTISPDTHKEHEEVAPDAKSKIEHALFRKGGKKRDSQGEVEETNFQNQLCSSVKKELIKNTMSWGIEIKEIALSDIQFKDQEVAEKLAAATSNTRTAEAEFDLVQANNKIRIEKAKTLANERLIAERNAAKVKKIEVESRSQLALIQQTAEVKAKAMKRNQEIKTYCDQIEKSAIADATKIRKLAEARRDAAKMKAEGQKALAEAAIQQYSDPNILQLEMMKCWMEGCKKLVNAPQPAVLLQSGNAEGMGTSGMVDLFRLDGKARLDRAFGLK